MEPSSLNAISPIDGRYFKQCEELSVFFSEAALIRYRVKVEVEYFIALSEIPLPEMSGADPKLLSGLRGIADNFTISQAGEVKAIERTTNHDVKAIEYFLKQHLENTALKPYKEFVHFGLTSQDINNTAFPMLIKDAVAAVYIPLLFEIIEKLNSISEEWRGIPMLSRTHGQPASPTRLGKEISVFVERLANQRDQLLAIPMYAKFGGATGNFNAHHAAYPEVDWIRFANSFVKERLGLQRLQHTTQIEHYDSLAALFDALKRINNILIDLNRDMWSYISMNYFRQKIKSGEVGSSAMPHKVNPIDFENSEGNLGIANALFEHLSAKLPISRLQRDLTDSTVLRNVGVPFAHSLIAFKSLLKGLGKLIVNNEVIHADLDNNWAVVAEGIQTILRRHNYPEPYEKLKELTRVNSNVNAETIARFINTLEVNEEVKAKLKALTPFNYTGI